MFKPQCKHFGKEKKNQQVGSFLHSPLILGKDMYFFPKCNSVAFTFQ